MKLIDKDALVAEINDKINVLERNSGYIGVFGNGQLDAYDNMSMFIDTLEVKEVDFEAFGVLANHLIACDAHGITPKYSDRELDFLEGLANEGQKGE